MSDPNAPGPPTPSSAEEDGNDDQSHIVDLARGTFINLIGKAGRWARALSIVVITNMFGAAVYGLYDTAWKIILIAYKVARVGLHRSITAEVVKCRADNDEDGCHQIIGRGLVIGLVASIATTVGLYFGADYIASWFSNEAPDRTQLVLTIRIMAWSLPFMVLAVVLIAATWALRIMKYEVYVNSIGGPLFLLLGTLAAGFCGWGLEGLATAPILMAFGLFMLSLLYFRSHFSLGASLRQFCGDAPWSRLTNTAFPVMLSDVVNTLVVSLDSFMLFKMVSPEAAGIYQAARQFSTVMKKIPQAFDPIFAPIVTDLTHRRQTRELEDNLAFVLRWICITTLAYMGLVWVGGEILMRVFGPKFTAGATIAWVLCLSTIALGLTIPMETLLIMSGHPYVNLLNNTIWLVSMFFLNYWLIPLHQGVGAAWSVTISASLAALVRLIQARYLLDIRPLRWSLLKPFVAAAAGFAAAEIFKRLAQPVSLWSLLPELIIFLVFFSAALYLQGFDARDRMLLNKARSYLRERRENKKSDPA